jgi:predicted amidophosphoribosyltransferase
MGRMENTSNVWGDALAEAVGVVLPVECVGCGRADRALCHGCRAALDAHPGRVRLVAGVRCDAAFEYSGLARTLLLAFKVHGRTDLAGHLGRPTVALLRESLAAAPPDTLVLRVPSSVVGRRRRGFDPVVMLLRRGGSRPWTRPRTGRLHRVRSVSRGSADAIDGIGGVMPPDRALADAGGGQKSLTALERVAATVGTLRAVGVADRDVVLVDDVVTTGVTMAEAVRAVRSAGGRVVRCVATASVEPPTPLEGPS